LARASEEITLGQVLRAVDGPLAEVRGMRPHETTGEGVSAHLPVVWIALRAAMRQVLDETTLAQVVTGRLPRQVQRMADDPAAWLPR
jgi:DNA-binding IscR family transcriptional regulator